MRVFALRLGTAALAASLAACALKPVGPDYHLPASAIVNRPGAAAPFAQAPASAAADGSSPFADAPCHRAGGGCTRTGASTG